MNQLVSIVVPAYNAAKRIEATLLSLVVQDYAHIEIIVVDDGSSDGTSGAAEKALRASGRNFKVIKHDTNMGLSAARNSGLSALSGDYVIFFDADDLADGNFVSVLLEAVTENDSDAAFCGYRCRAESTGGEREFPIRLDPSRKYAAEDLALMNIFNQIRPLVCTTVFKTNFLETTDLKFTPNRRFSEDTEFLMKAFSRCGSINFSTGCHYIYMQHEDQMTKDLRRTHDKECRYVFIAEVARYIAEYSESPKLRSLAVNFMLPDGLINLMTYAAREQDKAKFYQILRESETRRALIRCLRNLARKPELFCKAAALLTAPWLYYRIRSKPRKPA